MSAEEMQSLGEHRQIFLLYAEDRVLRITMHI